MVALRALFAVMVTALAVLLLSDGQPGGAIVVVMLGIWLRRAVEAGRMSRIVGRFARTS
jgi:hypothetical protein